MDKTFHLFFQRSQGVSGVVQVDNKCLLVTGQHGSCRKNAPEWANGRWPASHKKLSPYREGVNLRATWPSKQQTRLGHVACLATDVGGSRPWRTGGSSCPFWDLQIFKTGPIMGQEIPNIPNICNFVRSTDFYVKPQNDPTWRFGRVVSTPSECNLVVWMSCCCSSTVVSPSLAVGRWWNTQKIHDSRVELHKDNSRYIRKDFMALSSSFCSDTFLIDWLPPRWWTSSRVTALTVRNRKRKRSG